MTTFMPPSDQNGAVARQPARPPAADGSSTPGRPPASNGSSAPAGPPATQGPPGHPGLQFHPLRIRRVEREADDAVVLTFDVPEALRPAFAYTQGQHLTLRRVDASGELRRSYSICSGLDDDELQVGVRRVAGGVVSGWIHDGLAAGDVVEVLPPQGRFFVPLDAAAARHYLGIAAGSGITPILSILRTVLAREPRSRFTLIYGNRSPRSTMFKEALEDLKNRYLTRFVLHTVFSREATDLPLANGRLTRAKLAEFIGPLIDPGGIAHAFVCGPQGVDAEAEAALTAAGVPREHIHVERFGVPVGEAPPPRQRAGDAARARITIVRDGLTRAFDYRDGDADLLAAAAAAGLELPYSCRSGVCCTCRARLLEGGVRMERNFALEPHEVAAGYVLTCQAHPLSERVHLSFDER